ncbi:MAG: TIGR04086 family membrane protein [Bacillota bacterium]|nr:TIGR04086 family membrane protein [Bacillota bacterium]
MNENRTDLKSIGKCMLKSLMTGLGTYFILNAVCVLVLWFTPVPEQVMTYAGGICLAGGCFAGGLKMGIGTGRKGIFSGFAAALVISAAVWAVAAAASGGNILGVSSVFKIIAGITAGIAGGMLGVNK